LATRYRIEVKSLEADFREFPKKKKLATRYLIEAEDCVLNRFSKASPLLNLTCQIPSLKRAIFICTKSPMFNQKSHKFKHNSLLTSESTRYFFFGFTEGIWVQSARFERVSKRDSFENFCQGSSARISIMAAVREFSSGQQGENFHQGGSPRESAGADSVQKSI